MLEFLGALSRGLSLVGVVSYSNLWQIPGGRCCPGVLYNFTKTIGLLEFLAGVSHDLHVWWFIASPLA